MQARARKKDSVRNPFQKRPRIMRRAVERKQKSSDERGGCCREEREMECER